MVSEINCDKKDETTKNPQDAEDIEKYTKTNIFQNQDFKAKFTKLFVVRQDTTEGDKLLSKGKVLKGNYF